MYIRRLSCPPWTLPRVSVSLGVQEYLPANPVPASARELRRIWQQSTNASSPISTASGV